MSRNRKLLKEEQTHFSKTFYDLGRGNYLTDFDNVQVVNTENKVYQHYTYMNNKPIVRRIVEVKHQVTDYIRKQIKGEAEPNSQTKVFASVVSEINGFRKEHNQPLCEFYYVIENEGEYPYHVFNVTNTKGKINYEYVSKIENDEDFENTFSVD